MTKLRVNHRRHRGATSGMVLRLGLFTFFLLALLFLPKAIQNTWTLLEVQGLPADERFFLPDSDSTKVIHEKFFSYLSESDSVHWVTYQLQSVMLERSKDVKRPPSLDFNFLPISEFAFTPLNFTPESYPLDSGLQIDHLSFNQLLWNITQKSSPTYVTRGVNRDSTYYPKALYTAFLALESEPQKGSAQYIDLETNTSRVISIDSLEELIDLNLFHNFMPPILENKIEGGIDMEGE